MKGGRRRVVGRERVGAATAWHARPEGWLEPQRSSVVSGRSLCARRTSRAVPIWGSADVEMMVIKTADRPTSEHRLEASARSTPSIPQRRAEAAGPASGVRNLPEDPFAPHLGPAAPAFTLSFGAAAARALKLNFSTARLHLQFSEAPKGHLWLSPWSALPLPPSSHHTDFSSAAVWRASGKNEELTFTRQSLAL